MNYSLYINQIKSDVNQMWLDSLGSYSEKSYRRAFSDEVETAFWKEHSKVYDVLPSLYTYAPEVLSDIVEIIGRDKRVIELGAGTGQFTLPMSKLQKSIIAVDYSKDMLNQMRPKLDSIKNVTLINSKIEDIKQVEADVVYGVNCIYRIKDIKKCIENLLLTPAKKVLFVWTMQRSMYDAILNKTEKKGILRKQEYIHIVNILYEMGIDCDLKVKKVFKNIEIEDMEHHYKELLDISIAYDLDYENLKAEFDENVVKGIDGLRYKCEQKIAFISFDCMS